MRQIGFETKSPAQWAGSVLLLLCLTVITWAALRAPLLAAGFLYVCAFTAIAWARPGIALMLVFAGAPFQNDLSGGAAAKFSIAEINLVLTAGVCMVQRVLQKEPLSLGPIAFPTFAYFAICLYTTFQHPHGTASLLAMFQMVLYLVVAVIVFSSFAATSRELHLPLYGLVVVGVLFAIIGLVSHSNYFLGIHKNGIGGSLGAAFVVGAELWISADNPKRKRLLGIAMLVITVGLVQSLSRGAWMSALIGLVIILTMRKRFAMLFRIALLMVPVIAVSWSLLPQEAKTYSTDLSVNQHGSVGTRLTNASIAYSYFVKSPITGSGVGLRKLFDATNLFLFTLAESGILGLAAFLAIHVAFLWMVGATRRGVPLSDPAFSLLTVGTALLIGKLVHGQVDHYWSRGQVLMAWAGAGMATWAYFATWRGTQSREVY